MRRASGPSKVTAPISHDATSANVSRVSSSFAVATADAGSRRAGIVLCFGDFEYLLDSGELLGQGRSVRLQPQPARVLEALARRSGEVVPRRQLQLMIWGEGVHVDFEEGLNYCIKEIRRALGDRVREARYVETVPRRGYRFLPEVRVRRRSPKVMAVEARSAPPSQRWLAVTRLIQIGRQTTSMDLDETLREELIARLAHRLGPSFGVAPLELTRLIEDRRRAQLVVEGSLRSDGGDLEVNLRLLDVERNLQLLVRRYKFPFDDGPAASPGARPVDAGVADALARDLVAVIPRPEESPRT
ncbi:MAG TPA: winged helix-turn-helix domain-containing protein [Thermoanaerobaculia bacterium]|nr:winged helix-turn-helix domain-containing protein [Thermoanaerobaculia bacterium]